MKVKVKQVSEEKAVIRLLDNIKPPEPEIFLETLGGGRWYTSESEFEKDCIQMKDGRWRKRWFWERKKD